MFTEELKLLREQYFLRALVPGADQTIDAALAEACNIGWVAGARAEREAAIRFLQDSANDLEDYSNSPFPEVT